MTDKELIKALKHCGDPDKAMCYGCPGRRVCRENPGLPIDRMAADRLEALLAENERLKAGVQMAVELDPDTGSFSIGFQQPRPKWVSADEQLPVLSEKEKYWIEQLGADFAPEFIALIKGATAPTVLRFDGEKWRDDDGTWYRVTFWCELPEPPSTEGVE